MAQDVGDTNPGDGDDVTPPDQITNRSEPVGNVKPQDAGFKLAQSDDPVASTPTTSAVGGQSKRGKITSVNDDDTLTVAELGDSDNTITNRVVARSTLLRKSLLSRGVETYVYSDSQTRVADNGSIETNQKVIPSFLVDDIIFFQEAEDGTGVAGADFIDLNVDSRAWCITSIV